VLLESSVAFKTDKMTHGMAKLVYDRYKNTFKGGLEKLAESNAIRFPFNSQRWAETEAQLAKRIHDCIFN